MQPIEWIRGKTVVGVERDDRGTTFHFDRGGALRVECLWRIITKGRVWLTSEDDLQTFGLLTPNDAGPAAFAMLVARVVTECAVTPDTGDLSLSFAKSIRLECIRDTSGYARWQLTAPDGMQVIARGGDGLAEA